MKNLHLLLCVLGTLALAACVADDHRLQVARPEEVAKKNTFDDLKPRPDDGGFDGRPSAPRRETP